MTASINFKANTSAAWTNAHEGEVLLCSSTLPVAYLTPENARALAADLLRDADKAEAQKKGG